MYLSNQTLPEKDYNIFPFSQLNLLKNNIEAASVDNVSLKILHIFIRTKCTRNYTQNNDNLTIVLGNAVYLLYLFFCLSNILPGDKTGSLLCPRHSKNGGGALSVTPVRASVRACVRPSVIKIWCSLNNFWVTIH